MNSKVIHQFNGLINGVVFDDKEIYYTVDYILSEVEDFFNVKVPYTLIKDLKNMLKNLYLMIPYGSEGQVEDDLIDCVENAETIKQLKFRTCCASSTYFDVINDKLADWDNTYGKDPIIYNEINSI